MTRLSNRVCQRAFDALFGADTGCLIKILLFAGCPRELRSPCCVSLITELIAQTGIWRLYKPGNNIWNIWGDLDQTMRQGKTVLK